MANIVFKTEIWDQSEGAFDWHPGMITRRWAYRTMLRTDGEIAKPGGLSGCDHTLVLKFLSVPVSGLAAITTRMKNLARLLTEETLVVPDFGSYPNCSVKSVTRNPQKAGIVDIGPELDLVKCYNLEYTIVFRQSRP